MPKTAIEKGMPNRESMPAVPGELWRVAGKYGFNAPNNKRRNEDIRIEFSARIQVFLARLDNMAGNECTWRILDVIMKVDDRDRPEPPFSRKKVVPVEMVNMLTIIWACTLIRLGYRGLIRHGVLDLLKNEVIWFLSSMKYKLPVNHVLFCPFMTNWEKEKNWNVLESNEFRTKNFPAQPIASQPLPDVCVECMISAKTAQS